MSRARGGASGRAARGGATRLAAPRMSRLGRRSSSAFATRSSAIRSSKLPGDDIAHDAPPPATSPRSSAATPAPAGRARRGCDGSRRAARRRTAGIGRGQRRGRTPRAARARPPTGDGGDRMRWPAAGARCAAESARGSAQLRTRASAAAAPRTAPRLTTRSPRRSAGRPTRGLRQRRQRGRRLGVQRVLDRRPRWRRRPATLARRAPAAPATRVSSAPVDHLRSIGPEGADLAAWSRRRRRDRAQAERRALIDALERGHQRAREGVDVAVAIARVLRQRRAAGPRAPSAAPEPHRATAGSAARASARSSARTRRRRSAARTAARPPPRASDRRPARRAPRPARRSPPAAPTRRRDRRCGPRRRRSRCCPGAGCRAPARPGGSPTGRRRSATRSAAPPAPAAARRPQAARDARRQRRAAEVLDRQHADDWPPDSSMNASYSGATYRFCTVRARMHSLRKRPREASSVSRSGQITRSATTPPDCRFSAR